jgi:hypothetical protein
MTGFKIRQNFLNIFFFSSKGFFYAANRMSAFPMRENASLALIQGRCIEAKIKTFSFLCKKWTFLGIRVFL